MSLTDSGLKALLPKEKKYRVSVGDALFVIVYPNGGKYFIGITRFPPSSPKNRVGDEVRIGPYGKAPGWVLSE